MDDVDTWLAELRKRNASNEEVANALRAQGYIEADVQIILAKYNTVYHPHPVRTALVVLFLLIIIGYGISVLFATEIAEGIQYGEARIAWGEYSNTAPILAEYRAGNAPTCSEWVRVKPHPKATVVEEEQQLCSHAFAIRDKNVALCSFDGVYDVSCVTLVGYALGSTQVCSRLTASGDVVKCTADVNNYLAVTQNSPELCTENACRWIIAGNESSCSGNSVCIAFFTEDIALCPEKGTDACVTAIALRTNNSLLCDELSFRARSCRKEVFLKAKLCPECDKTVSEMPELMYEAVLPLFPQNFHEYLALSRADASSRLVGYWLTPGFNE